MTGTDAFDDRVRSLALGPKEKTVAAGMYDGRVLLFEVKKMAR